MNFVFNALWENMVWICDANTSQRRVVKGNYHREQSEFFAPENNSGGDIWLGIVAYHKHISPDASDAGSYPWIQSRMGILANNIIVNPNSSYDIIGFNDNDIPNYPADNVRITINHIGPIIVPPSFLHRFQPANLNIEPMRPSN